MTESEDAELSRDDALADAIAALPANAEPEPEPEAPAEPVEAQSPVEAPAQPAEPARPAEEPADGRLSALIAERTRRRELEQKLAEYERRFAAQPVAAPVEASKPPVVETPSVKFEDNPAEWLRQNTEIQARRLEAHEKELQSRVKAYEEETQREQQQRQQAEYVQRLDNEYRNVWAEKARAEPAALEAHGFFASQFIAEAMAIGRTRGVAEQMLIQAERQLAYEAFTNELNPADLIIARARARGWAPTPAAAVQLQPAVAAPAPAAAPAADQAAQRRAAGSKLSAASGAAAPTMPSLQEIASMPRDEYGRWRKKNPDGFEKLIGAA